MGTELQKQLLIHKKITKELNNKEIPFNENKENDLRQLCSSYFKQLSSSYFYDKQEEIILEKDFKHLLQLSEPEKFDILFKIFGRNIEKIGKIITFNDIKYLYYCFLSRNPKIKSIFIGFLLFENNDKIKYIDFNNNIYKIFPKDIDLQSHLLKYVVDNDDSEYFILTNFLNFFNKDEEYLKNFKFIKKFYEASKYKLKLIKNEDLNYICDCAQILSEENNENNLDSMKSTYDKLTRNTNNVLYFKDFQNILEKYQINKKIINLVIEYLKKYTQKDFCFFDDIKYIFTNLYYSLSLIDKKKFLFKMILTLCDENNQLTSEQINKYLNIDYNEIQNKNNAEENSNLYEENDFINNNIFDEMINKLNPYLEDFGL